MLRGAAVLWLAGASPHYPSQDSPLPGFVLRAGTLRVCRSPPFPPRLQEVVAMLSQFRTNKAPRSRYARLSLERLEDRDVPSLTLNVSYGANKAVTLTGTLGNTLTP